MFPILNKCPSLKEQCLSSYLTFGEVSGTMRVSKGWREEADRIRRMMSQPGMNTGFLYSIIDGELNAGHIYLDRPHGFAKDVIALNPLLRAVFAKAKVVVATKEWTDEFRELALSFLPIWEEQLGKWPTDRLDKMHKSLLKHLEQHLTADQWAEHQTLIDNTELPRKIILGFMQSFSTTILRDGHPSNEILAQAERTKKPSRDLTEQLAAPSIFFFKCFIEVSIEHPRFFEMLIHNIGEFEQAYLHQGLAWKLGHNKFYDETLFPFSEEGLIDDVAEQEEADAKLSHWTQLIDQFDLELNRKREDTEPAPDFEALQKQCKQAQRESESAAAALKQKRKEERERVGKFGARLESRFLNYTEQIADKIVELLPSDQSPLIVLPITCQRVLEELKTRGIMVNGPLRAPLKPRGFIWQLTNAEGHKGHLVGSIHRAPVSLFNFHRTMLETFQQAKVLALEIELNQEAEAREAQERSKYLRTEIQALPDKTRDKLATIFKKSLPIETEAPQERDEFLLWIAQHLLPVALKRIGMEKGLDHRFLEMALSQDKQIEGQESLDLHNQHAAKLMPSLTGISREGLTQIAETEVCDTEQILQQIQKQLKTTLGEYAKLWEFGLVEELERPREDQDTSDAEIMQKRNIAMAGSVAKLIADGKTPFCVVGLEHTRGPDSMLKILEQTHRVKQVVCEEPDVPKLLSMCQKMSR